MGVVVGATAGVVSAALWAIATGIWRRRAAITETRLLREMLERTYTGLRDAESSAPAPFVNPGDSQAVNEIRRQMMYAQFKWFVDTSRAALDIRCLNLDRDKLFDFHCTLTNVEGIAKLAMGNEIAQNSVERPAEMDFYEKHLFGSFEKLIWLGFKTPDHPRKTQPST